MLLYPPEWLRDHDREVSEAEARSVAGASSPDIMISRIEALLRFDGRALTPRIRCPTLVIAALDDRITPPYFSRALAQAIPERSLVLLDGGGHFLPIVEAERYAEIVVRFLSEPGGGNRLRRAAVTKGEKDPSPSARGGGRPAGAGWGGPACKPPRRLPRHPSFARRGTNWVPASRISAAFPGHRGRLPRARSSVTRGHRSPRPTQGTTG